MSDLKKPGRNYRGVRIIVAFYDRRQEPASALGVRGSVGCRLFWSPNYKNIFTLKKFKYYICKVFTATHCFLTLLIILN